MRSLLSYQHINRKQRLEERKEGASIQIVTGTCRISNVFNYLMKEYTITLEGGVQKKKKLI